MRKVILFVFSFFAMILISCSTPPEEKLANHIDEIAQIMSENEEDPKALVDKFDEYYQSNFGDILSAMGEALNELNDLGPKERAERVAVMMKEIGDAFERNKDILESFKDEYFYEESYREDERCHKKYYNDRNWKEYEEYCREEKPNDRLEELADAIEDKYGSANFFDLKAFLDKADELDLDKPSDDLLDAFDYLDDILDDFGDALWDAKFHKSICDNDCEEDFEDFFR